tara:strand:- start:1640 stop:3631 length:1992 start_codon:yes stop_codon:yes gene_type:complete
MAPPTNKKNVRNPDSGLFRQLTKLLSGPLAKYRRQDSRQLKKRQLDKYKSRFKSASGQEFKMSAYEDVYSSLQSDYYANQNRMDRYVDFDQMEYTPEISSALDIHADEMTTFSVYRPMVEIICTNQEIKSTIETLLYNILNVQFNLYGWCRSMCKYGDFFLYLDIEQDEGIKNTIGLPANEIERLEGEDKNNPNYIQYQWNTGGITLENWQIGHFRVLGNDKFAPYGTSILDGARRIWRQLTLLEDAVMAYRIVRSPERRVFYIDVGGIPPEDVEQYMQKVMTQMKRNQIVNADTGQVDLRYNPFSIEEDYYIPVRGGETGTKIETVASGKYTGEIDDVKYLRDKLFSALKIPMSYLSRGEGSDEDKATLAQKDIRFARTVQRLQRSVVSELEKIVIIHLFTLGYRGNDLLSFKLALNNPSRLAELQELEHWKSRFDAADGASNSNFFSRRWISKNILSVSEEEFDRMQSEMFYDRKHDFLLEQVGEALASDPGGMGALDADAAPDAGAPPDVDLDAADTTPAEPEEPGALLATPGAPAPGTDAGTTPEVPPGKRDVKDKFGRRYTTTGASKGKYYSPTVSDRRTGAMQSFLAQGGQRSTGASTKSIFPGKDELSSIYKFTEAKRDSNYYDQKEKEILQESKEVKDLIESLETLESIKDETKT